MQLYTERIFIATKQASHPFDQHHVREVLRWSLNEALDRFQRSISNVGNSIGYRRRSLDLLYQTLRWSGATCTNFLVILVLKRRSDFLTWLPQLAIRLHPFSMPK